MSTLPCSRAGATTSRAPSCTTCSTGKPCWRRAWPYSSPRSSLSGKSKEASWMTGRRGSSGGGGAGARSQPTISRARPTSPTGSAGRNLLIIGRRPIPSSCLLLQGVLSGYPPVHGTDGGAAASGRWRAGGGRPAPAGVAGAASATVGRGPAAAPDPEPQRAAVADRRRRRAGAVGGRGRQPAHGRARHGDRPRGGRVVRRDAHRGAHRRHAGGARPRAGRAGSCSGRRWWPWSPCAASGTCSCSSAPPWP